MVNINSEVFSLLKLGIGVKETARRLDLTVNQVEYMVKKAGLQGSFRKKQKKVVVAPGIQELIEEYDYVGFELTERGTVICTIGDVSGDEQAKMKNALNSAYKKILELEV